MDEGDIKSWKGLRKWADSTSMLIFTRSLTSPRMTMHSNRAINKLQTIFNGRAPQDQADALPPQPCWSRSFAESEKGNEYHLQLLSVHPIEYSQELGER